ncbi:MAG: carotenoid 1,2-hydratase, partial [Chloroflexota bacterium]
MKRGRTRIASLGFLAVMVAACSGPILANPPASVPVVPTASPRPIALPDPQPIVFPRDDGAHHRLTEWWYYTGHLADDAGGRWGFEFVIFRAERGGFPVTWASHFALTDEVAGTFRYDQRTVVGPQADRSLAEHQPFLFVLSDPNAPVFTEPTAQPSILSGSLLSTSWAMGGSSGSADFVAAMDGGRLGIQLHAEALPNIPPVLHAGDGWIDFGPAGGSYYYSRPRLAVTGDLAADGLPHAVHGTAWFDHQWGDFISVGGGGWDWFAVNLSDGTDLTISLVRAADGSTPLVYGTLVDASGHATNLDRTAFEVIADPARTWTSPATGA